METYSIAPSTRQQIINVDRRVSPDRPNDERASPSPSSSSSRALPTSKLLAAPKLVIHPFRFERRTTGRIEKREPPASLRVEILASKKITRQIPHEESYSHCTRTNYTLNKRQNQRINIRQIRKSERVEARDTLQLFERWPKNTREIISTRFAATNVRSDDSSADNYLQSCNA